MAYSFFHEAKKAQEQAAIKSLRDVLVNSSFFQSMYDAFPFPTSHLDSGLCEDELLYLVTPPPLIQVTVSTALGGKKKGDINQRVIELYATIIATKFSSHHVNHASPPSIAQDIPSSKSHNLPQSIRAAAAAAISHGDQCSHPTAESTALYRLIRVKSTP